MVLWNAPPEPVVPVDPVPPTEPVVPVDPVPVDPVDPVPPTDPVVPVDPVPPTDPVVPVDPVPPTDPVVPVDPVTPEEPTAEEGQWEYGSINIDHNLQTVLLEKTFVNPVVIMGALSFNGPHPSTVRVMSVTSTSFQVQIQEWTYLDT